MKWLVSAASAASSSLGRESRLISTLRPTYNRILDFLYAETGMETRVGDETLKICPRIRNFAQVERDVYDFMRVNILPGNTVLDVGSYLGVYAMISGRLAGASGLVVAFEPTAASLLFLHRHLVMNGVGDRVRVIACAIGQCPGMVNLFEHPDAYLNSVGIKNPTATSGAAVPVPMLSIDAACELFHLSPDLIRVDVQGLEADVLQGAAQTIRNHPQLKIIVEVHPQLWPLHGLNEAKFQAQLGDLGLNASAPAGGPPDWSPDAHIILESRAAAVETP